MSNTGLLYQNLPRIDAKTSYDLRPKKGWWDLAYYFNFGRYTKYDGNFDRPLYSKTVLSVQWSEMWRDFKRAFILNRTAWATAIIIGLLVFNRRPQYHETPLFIGAVAFDSFTGGTQTTTTSKTLGHTVAALSDAYVVGFTILHLVSTDEISGVKWDPTGLNTTMTSHVTKATTSGNLGNKRMQAWGAAIGTGTGASKNMTATLTNQSISIDIVSATGVSQVATPDTGTAEYNPTGTQPYAYTVSSVSTADSLLVGCAMFYTGSGYSGGTNTTVDGQPETSRGIFHSTALVGTGSQSLSLANSGDDDNAGVVLALAPGGTTHTKTCTEASTWTDALIKQFSRLFTEASTWTDVLTTLRARVVTLLEASTWTDIFNLTISRTLTEASTWTDVMNRTMTRLYVEAVTWTDVVTASLARLRTFTEASTWTARLRLFLNGFTTGIWSRTAKPTNQNDWSKTAKPDT